MKHVTFLSVVSAILAAGLAAPAVAAPDSHGIAAAGTQCYPNTKTFKRGTTQRTVTINLCVQRIGSSTLRAYADISMGKKSGTPDIVYDATLNVRLEHNDDPIESTADSMGYEINDESASAWGWIVSTDEFSSTVVGGWSADGVVYYDLVGDGLGTQAWELHGSPTI